MYVHIAKADNILAFLPTGSPSHLIVEMAVVKAMAERQHNVTVVTGLPLDHQELKAFHMKHIQLDKGHIDMEITINATKTKSTFGVSQLFAIKRIMTEKQTEIFEDPKFKSLLQNRDNKFDLLLYGYLFADYFYGLAEHFDCPVALLWPNMPISSISKQIGNPLAISYVSSNILGSGSSEINFNFRLKNFISAAVEIILYIKEQNFNQEIYG